MTIKRAKSGFGPYLRGWDRYLFSRTALHEHITILLCSFPDTKVASVRRPTFTSFRWAAFLRYVRCGGLFFVLHSVLPE